MKRILSTLILATLLLLTLPSCGTGKPEIEDYDWKMRTIMHVENNQVIVDATGEYTTAHSGAKVINMTLTAKDGIITINDNTNNKTYEGTYSVSGKNPQGTDYKITIDGKSGYATVAMTKYADGTEEPTLPISLDGHSMYFYAN